MITYIDIYLLAVTAVYFFLYEEWSCKGKKKIYSTISGKVSQSPGIKMFFLFSANEKKIWNIFFFLSYKIKYFNSCTIDTSLSQQNSSDKLLKVGNK